MSTAYSYDFRLPKHWKNFPINSTEQSVDSSKSSSIPGEISVPCGTASQMRLMMAAGAPQNMANSNAKTVDKLPPAFLAASSDHADRFFEVG